MVDLTFEDLGLQESQVKDLLDEPAKKYLKTATIQALQNKAYNFVAYQIDIVAGIQLQVKDAINSLAAWWAFGIYGQSISNSLQLQDIGAYRANLDYYKEIAKLSAAIIGVDIERSSKPVLDDALPVIGSGRSMIDVDE